jgi:hypothetical protein
MFIRRLIAYGRIMLQTWADGMAAGEEVHKLQGRLMSQA